MGLSDGESLQYQIEELQQRATKDTLSGLLNRATMEQHIKRRLQRMEPDETCALFIVDLDNFKSVNDTLATRPATGPYISRPASSPASSAPTTSWAAWAGTSLPCSSAET